MFEVFIATFTSLKNKYMKQFYLLLFSCLTISLIQAQIVNIPDTAFKNILLENDCVDTNNDNIGDSNIDLNNDGEIQLNEALAVISLVIPNNEYLDTATSSLTYIADFTGLEAFSNMEKLTIDTSANNTITTPLVSVDLGDNNQNLREIRIPDYRGLNNFNLGTKPNLELLEIFNALQLNAIDFSGAVNLETLYLGMTVLTNVDLSQNVNLISFNIDMFGGTNLDFSQNLNLETIGISYPNGLSTIDVSNNINLKNLSTIGAFDLLNIDVSNNTLLETLNASQNFALETLNIKNGSVLSNLEFPDSSMLGSVCVDNEELNDVAALVSQYGITNCIVNTYCSLDPGGAIFTVEGVNRLDLNNNGCDVGDAFFPELQFNIANGGNNSIAFSNNSGNYNLSLYEGESTITPQLENSAYFSTIPTSIVVDFPTDNSPNVQDFCIVPNGVHDDLEITIVPVVQARPGFNAPYKLIYKNKGNTTLSGDITFNYSNNSNETNFLSASPSPVNDTNGILLWNYTNLLPFETRTIDITMDLNTPTNPNFPLNGGDILSYIAEITPIANDETEGDNSMSLRQLVVNSFDPNDKTCLEGEEIEESTVGKYLHYLIRFENTGTANAINIVVKDIIDQTKYDVTSLIPLNASHSFVTRIQNTNEVEFIFENINLPFDDANNDGYVLFKIKTLPTLVEGDIFSNTAEIYFDFNFPIITNDEETLIVTNSLSVVEFNEGDVKVSPNPVQNELIIETKSNLKEIAIYNSNGQLVIRAKNETLKLVSKIDTSKLTAGLYFTMLKTDKGVVTRKIIKE